MTQVTVTYQTQSWLHFLKKLRRDLVAKHFALRRTTCTYLLTTSWSRACAWVYMRRLEEGSRFKDNKSLPQQMRWGLRSPQQRRIKHLLAAGEKLEWKTQNSNQTRHWRSVSITVWYLMTKEQGLLQTTRGMSPLLSLPAPPPPVCSCILGINHVSFCICVLILGFLFYFEVPLLISFVPLHILILFAPPLITLDDCDACVLCLSSGLVSLLATLYFHVFFYAPFCSISTVFSSPPCTFWTSLLITNLWLAGRRKWRGCHHHLCWLYISLSGSSQSPARVGTTTAETNWTPTLLILKWATTSYVKKATTSLKSYFKVSLFADIILT